MQKNLLLAIVLCVLLHSCKEKDNTQILDRKPTEIDLALNRNIEKKDLYKTFKNFQFVKLQTTDSSLVTEVSEIIQAGDKLLIVDRRKRAILVFDTAGKYLHDIGTVGHGPGEFMDISDCLYEKSSNTVYICSNESSSVLKFSLEGKFLGSRRFRFFPGQFAKFNEKFVFFTNNNLGGDAENYNLVFTDSGNVIKNRFFQISDDKRPTYDFTGFICQVDDSTLLYNEALSETVYQVDNKGVIFPKYHFNFSNYKMPEELKSDFDKFRTDGLKYSHLGRSFFEDKNRIVFSYIHDRKLYLGIWDKDKQILYNGREFADFGMAHQLVDFVGVLNDKLVSKLDIARLLEGMNEAQELKAEIARNLPQLYSILGQSKATDNPILAIYKL